MPTTAKVLYIVGASVLVVGAVAGLMPLESGGQCGSVFFPKLGPGAGCDGLLSALSVPAWAGVLVGGGLLLGGLVAYPPQSAGSGGEP